MTTRWQGRVLLFDLFGTVVHFAPHVPTIEVAGTRRRSTLHWLRDVVERELPEVEYDDLLAAVMRVTEELVRGRPPHYREVPSRERFRRALEQLGLTGERTPVLAERLSLAHMTHLAASTMLPAGHDTLLHVLGTRYRLGLVSNFDHAPTARRILADHGIARYFETIVISDEVGRRKPHPEIFATALKALGTSADDALFVGDSVSDDIVGAANAHLPVVWINAKNEALPPDVPAPQYVIADLRELRSIVGS